MRREPLMPFFVMALAGIVLLLFVFVTCAEAQSYHVRPTINRGYTITPFVRRRAHTPIDQWYFPSPRTYSPVPRTTYVPLAPTKHPALAWIPDSSTAWAERDTRWQWVRAGNRYVYRKVKP